MKTEDITILNDVVSFLKERVAISKISADNENYLIQLSIKEADKIIEILEDEQYCPNVNDYD